MVGTLSRTAPQIGDTVVLNVDTGLQEAVQNDLAAQILQDRRTPDVEDHNKLPPAINGAAIVLNPQNGQVLAMASYPTYDLNEWVGGISTANFAALQSTAGGEQLRHPGRVHPRLDLQADHRHGGPAGRCLQPVALLRRHWAPSRCSNCTGGTCTFTDDPGDSGGAYNLALALTVSSDSYFYNLGELFWEGRSNLRRRRHSERGGAVRRRGEHRHRPARRGRTGASTANPSARSCTTRNPDGVSQHHLVHG